MCNTSRRYKFYFRISFPFIILFNKRIDQHLLRGVIRGFYYSMFGFSMYVLSSSWFALQQAGDIEFTKALNYFTYEKLAGHLGIQPIYLSMYMVFSFFAVIWDFFLEPKVKLNSKGKILCQLWAFHVNCGDLKPLRGAVYFRTSGSSACCCAHTGERQTCR